MIKRTGETFGWNSGYDRRNGAFTGNASSTDHQLQHIDTSNISNETGIRGCGAFQCSITAGGLIREGPAIAQRFIGPDIRFGVIQHHRLTHSDGNDGSGNGRNVDKIFC